MKKTLVLFSIFFVLAGCSNKTTDEEYAIIDVVGSLEKYQRVYCSDYFSSIELIPLETKDECLLPAVPFPGIVLKDSFIFMNGACLYAFDNSGKFLNHIGKKGQGPGEYLYSTFFFLNTDNSVICVEDLRQILEYDFNGNHIRSTQKPELEDDNLIGNCSYAGDDLFIGSTFYNGKNNFKYCLFDRDGKIVKYFPNHIFFNRERKSVSTYDGAFIPIRIDNHLYLKDYVNDTLYILENSDLHPAYVFGFGKYSYPKENLELRDNLTHFPQNAISFGTGLGVVGMSNFFFYKIRVPDFFSKPKAKPRYSPFVNEYRPDDSSVYGIYNIDDKTNILLDTDEHLQKGIINDINGGLPVIPRYYAGNGIVVDVWNVEDMKEILTNEYFATRTIKDQQSHQKLKEVLKSLKDDDNPVVVVAKLKK